MATLLLATAPALAPARDLTPCHPVQPRAGGGAVLQQSGPHCLTGDMLVDSHYRLFAHGSNWRDDDHILLLIAASGIDLDLQGHTVTANAALRAAIETPDAHARNYPDVAAPVLPSGLTVRNGRIRVTRRGAFGMGIRIVSVPGMAVDLPSDLTESAADLTRQALPARAADYPQRHIVIDQVQLRSAGGGISVEGAGTVIRNSTIEVDAGTAIQILGPGALIENNTIIVHASNALAPADAAIRLHHGDGAVIRNNRIVLKGAAHPWAVSTFRTGPFNMQSNTVNGRPVSQDSTVRSF